MKKFVFIALLLGIMISSLGCVGVTTAYHAEKETYYAGETVKLYDNESYAQLGTLRITDVSVIRDEPYFCRSYLCSVEEYEKGTWKNSDEHVEIRGDTVYSLEEYAVVVQINYTASTLDSSSRITASDFYITDCNAQSADREVETHYVTQPTTGDSFVVGLKEKGDVNLSFSFNGTWSETCKIICEYDETTDSYIIMEDAYDDLTCPACGKQRDSVDAYCRYCGEKFEK